MQYPLPEAKKLRSQRKPERAPDPVLNSSQLQLREVDMAKFELLAPEDIRESRKNRGLTHKERAEIAEILSSATWDHNVKTAALSLRHRRFVDVGSPTPFATPRKQAGFWKALKETLPPGYNLLYNGESAYLVLSTDMWGTLLAFANLSITHTLCVAGLSALSVIWVLIWALTTFHQ